MRNFNTNTRTRITPLITPNVEVNKDAINYFKPSTPNKSYRSTSPIPNRIPIEPDSSPFRIREDATPDKGYNNIKNIQLDDNLNHEEYLEHLSETNIIDKADYIRSGMDRDRQKMKENTQNLQTTSNNQNL